MRCERAREWSECDVGGPGNGQNETLAGPDSSQVAYLRVGVRHAVDGCLVVAVGHRVAG